VIKYSVVIPEYNDAARLAKNLPVLMQWARTRADVEVIVVDDGSFSFDSSKAEGVCEEEKVLYYRLPVNKGKWGALKHGADKAAGQFIVIADADLSCHPSEIVHIHEVTFFGLNMVIAGDRNFYQTGIPFHRRLFGGVFSKLTRAIIPIPMPSDCQCPAKVLPNNRRLWWKLQENRFAGDVEVLAAFASNQVAVTVAHVHYVNDVESKVHPFKDGVSMFFALWRIRARVKAGVYQ
jgi:glycosyltransferase involved in cell wall biosynthesis